VSCFRDMDHAALSRLAERAIARNHTLALGMIALEIGARGRDLKRPRPRPSKPGEVNAA
jgi:hypothetical protein